MRGSKIILTLSTILIASQLSGCNQTKNSVNMVNQENTSVVEDINNDNAEEVSNTNDNKIDLLSEITPKLNTLEGIESVKKEINDEFKEILTKNNFPIKHATPNNGFVISELPYNKYTKDYNQTIYSLIAENYTDGFVDFRIIATKEFHKQDEQTETDDFIKCIYDLYTYTSKKEITLQEFVSKINNSISNDLSKVDLEHDYTLYHISISINDIDSSTKQLEFKVESTINSTLKRKYYRKEYETVSDYKNDTEAIKSKANEIEQKYYTGIGNIENNLHGVFNITLMSGQNKFMQTGNINVIGGLVTGKNEVPKFEENEVNELVNSYKLVLGDELFNKSDTSQLTIENLNKIVESQIIINTYAKKYNLPDVDMYLDNATVEFKNCGNFVEEDDESLWVFVSERRIADIYLKFSIPVTAEGITEM